MGSTRDTLKLRVRKTVKWGGLVVTVLLVVVWIGSGWGTITWFAPGGGGVMVDAGLLDIAAPLFDGLPGRFGEVKFTPNPAAFAWLFDSGWVVGFRYFTVPLWFPFLLSLLATAAAWRFDAKYLRRVREGACPSCGYDRAGLAAGSVCPECGAGDAAASA